MKSLFQPLLLLLAKSTESELARYVEFLKAENQILRRRLPTRLNLSPAEKRLILKLGQGIGPRLQQLLTVVCYKSYQRWLKREGFSSPTPPRPKRKPGRPRTPDQVRDLVLKLAAENDWGYTRILGELKKLGIRLCRTTVINILRQSHLDPKLDPQKSAWGQFLKAHMHSLWQCDFFSKHIVTPQGIRQCFILAFLHVACRRVFLSPCTFKPDRKWVLAQAKAFLEHVKREGLPAERVFRDRDGKFIREFDEALAAEGLQVITVQFRSPNLNAYVERFIQSIQQECLDKFIAFGQEHLDHLAREYVAYYHQERPHQGIRNEPLMAKAQRPGVEGQIVSCERLGGVLRHYYRQAA